MNSITNTASRRMTIAGYNHYLDVLREQEAKERAENEAIRRRAYEESLAESQANINSICNDITSSYNLMLRDGQERRLYSIEAKKKKEEEERFYLTADKVYSCEIIDESQDKKMRLLRFAYYLFPVLDCIFAFFALYPVITLKFRDLASVMPGVDIVIGTILSVIVGFVVSLFARLGMPSLEDNGKNSPLKGINIIGVAGAVFIIPLLYIAVEITFIGGSRWMFSGWCALLSLVNQILMVTSYSKHMDAFNYFRMKENNENTKQTRQFDENAIKQEILDIRCKMENTLLSFRQHFADFTEQYRNLVLALDRHRRQHNQEAQFVLSQTVIYFGNVVCFRYEPIPLKYNSGGSVLSVPFVDYDNVKDILTFREYELIGEMLNEIHSDIPFTETTQILEKHQAPKVTGQKQGSSNFGKDENAPVISHYDNDDQEDGPTWE